MTTVFNDCESILFNGRDPNHSLIQQTFYSHDPNYGLIQQTIQTIQKLRILLHVQYSGHFDQHSNSSTKSVSSNICALLTLLLFNIQYLINTCP